MLNTEQPGTSWYFLALRYAGPSTTLVDLSPQSALLLRDFGRSRSGYFPVGFLPDRLAAADKRPRDFAAVRGFEVRAASRTQWSRPQCQRMAGPADRRPLPWHLDATAQPGPRPAGLDTGTIQVLHPCADWSGRAVDRREEIDRHGGVAGCSREMQR